MNQQLQGFPVLMEALGSDEGNETYVPNPYAPDENVKFLHSFFRVGHANDFENLISGLSGNKDMTTDYILGVTASSMLIFAVALVWGLVIVCFMCAGQEKVGFLSGRMECPTQAQTSLHSVEECLTEDDEDVSIQTPIGHQSDQNQNKQARKFKRKALAVRAVFVISGLCVIICGSLFYAKGVTSFQHSLVAAQVSLYNVESTATEAIDLTNSLLDAKEQLFSGVKVTIAETGSAICQETEIGEEGQQLVSSIQEMSSAVDESLKSFGNDAMMVANTAKGINKDLETAKGFLYALIAISVIIVALICIMLAVTIFSARGISNCFTKCVTCALIWPVFVFLLILSWIFAILSLVSSLAGSDFCYKPDEIVIEILNKNKDKFSSMIFAFALYYVSGCTIVPQQMDEIQNMAQIASTLLATAQDFASNVASKSVDELATECGLETAASTALQKGANLILKLASSASTMIGNFKGIISCENINPIYTTLVHEATCTDAVDGLTWIYASCLGLYFFAMMMITFRAALYPVKRPEQGHQTGLSAPLLSSKNGY